MEIICYHGKHNERILMDFFNSMNVVKYKADLNKVVKRN